MRTRRELYQAAMRTVCARRQAARTLAQDANTAAQRAVPGLAAAQEAFRQAGIQVALAAAAGGDTAAPRAALQAAQAHCDALLRASGRAPDALEPHFTCPICQDTGSTNGRTCTCVQALMRKMRREELEAASSLSITSFDTMRADYYPDRRDADGHNIRRHMESTLAELREYADTFDRNSMNLLLIGNAGLGKTHAALAIAGAVLDKGYDVIYQSSPEFFARLEALHFTSGAAEQESALMDAACEADLLILDDLGTELISAFTISSLYTLLNTRTAARRPTVFTSNILDGALLEKRYTEKIASRLAGSCEQFVFLGDDIRLLRAEEAL
jgi:DNA replication protein DnaC